MIGFKDGKKKPKLNEWDESLDFIVGIGSFDSFTAVPTDDKKINKRRIGFVNNEPEQNIGRRSKKRTESAKGKGKQLVTKRSK